MADSLKAFVEPSFSLAGARTGPAAGTTFAVKDLYAAAIRIAAALPRHSDPSPESR
jgi:hypothetical protein